MQMQTYLCVRLVIPSHALAFTLVQLGDGERSLYSRLIRKRTHRLARSNRGRGFRSEIYDQNHGAARSDVAINKMSR